MERPVPRTQGLIFVDLPVVPGQDEDDFEDSKSTIACDDDVDLGKRR
jgi:hypothetical protein